MTSNLPVASENLKNFYDEIKKYGKGSCFCDEFQLLLSSSEDDSEEYNDLRIELNTLLKIYINRVKKSKNIKSSQKRKTFKKQEKHMEEKDDLSTLVEVPGIYCVVAMCCYDFGNKHNRNELWETVKNILNTDKTFKKKLLTSTGKFSYVNFLFISQLLKNIEVLEFFLEYLNPDLSSLNLTLQKSPDPKILELLKKYKFSESHIKISDSCLH